VKFTKQECPKKSGYLKLHPDKTRIVYCKDINRQGDFPCVQFTFLGYTFRPRKAMDKYGRVYVNFAPAVSRDALKGWHLQLKCDKSVADLSTMFNPIIRGWHQDYGRFYESAMSAAWKHLNDYLTRWMMRKYKHLARHKTRTGHALGCLARKFQNAFWHWKLRCLPNAG
jgi:RNA-directed DNA polymerase